jgi:hypothetical protein
MFTVAVPLRTATPEVTPDVMKLLAAFKGGMGRREIRARLRLLRPCFQVSFISTIAFTAFGRYACLERGNKPCPHC